MDPVLIEIEPKPKSIREMIKLQHLHNYPTTPRHMGWDPVHESLPFQSFVEVRENKGTNVWGPRPGDDALLHEVVLCVEGTKKKR